MRYSLRARQEQLDMIEYILERFGQAKAKSVFERIERILAEIAEMPAMYRSSSRKEGLRKCVLSKQTSIYYRILETHIEVVSFRPNRKDPKEF